MTGLKEVTIARRHSWTPKLMTLGLDFDGPMFKPGQFFNLGLKAGETVLRRSYSAASSPGAPLEFFLSEIPTGGLTPHVFGLQEGDRILIDDTPLGFFTLDEVPEARCLWLVATGTGLGPYISMLRDGSVLGRFERVVVVHGVRHPEQLAYREELESLASAMTHLVYTPVVSGAKERTPQLPGRITTQFESGNLEARVGDPFDADCHMLLCGNPAMIDEMTGLLKGRGFEKHRRRKPGHFNFERYW